MAERTSEGWVLRLGAVAGIVGALIGMVGNPFHSVVPTGDPEGIARTIAESEAWIPVHLAIVVGIMLMLGGLVAISQSIRGGLPGAVARLGTIEPPDVEEERHLRAPSSLSKKYAERVPMPGTGRPTAQ